MCWEMGSKLSTLSDGFWPNILNTVFKIAHETYIYILHYKCIQSLITTTKWKIKKWERGIALGTTASLSNLLQRLTTA